MMRIFATILIFSLSMSVTPTLVAAGAGGNPKAGQTKSELCQGCHGADGNSATGEFPRLAGQKMGYIVKQIKDFQSGSRVNDTMTGMAATIASIEDLKDIASYFSSQKMAKSSSSDASLVKKGEEIFINGNVNADVYGCVNCHGKDGKGKSSENDVFPVIGGQHKEYLIKQLNDFRKGERKNDPAGMMGDIAKKLKDEEIKAVAEYLSTL